MKRSTQSGGKLETVLGAGGSHEAFLHQLGQLGLGRPCADLCPDSLNLSLCCKKAEGLTSRLLLL